jgi:predicted transcriptional regulator
MAEQSFKNHARIVPMFHIAVFLPLIAYFLWAVTRAIRLSTIDSVMAALLALILLLAFFSLRGQVLTVQDRVIRLEMQLRLGRLLSTDMAARAERLPVAQLIALRFASDAEIPELLDEVLNGRLTTQKEIKARIVQWNADHLRA